LLDEAQEGQATSVAGCGVRSTWAGYPHHDPGAFSNLPSLYALYLSGNQFTSLNLTGADLAAITDLRLDTAEIDTLIVDGATLSQASFDVIVNSASSITEGRFVGPDLTARRTRSVQVALAKGTL